MKKDPYTWRMEIADATDEFHAAQRAVQDAKERLAKAEDRIVWVKRQAVLDVFDGMVNPPW